ncbi:MAG: peptidoglycan binding domain-containing protein [Chloroflexi bacterium]|nr:peptidoglycan binding domain-containing protein [Chloroflexota bacterium]
MRTTRKQHASFDLQRLIRQYLPPLPRKRSTWLLLGGGSLIFFVSICAVITLGVGILWASGSILPGVRAGGVDVGGKSVDEAAVAIETHWQQNGIILDDEGRQWSISPADLGIVIDSTATAQAANDYGRSSGNIFSAIFGAKVAPVLNVNLEQTYAKLSELTVQIDLPARNAGVALVNGGVVPTPAENGRVLDIDATVQQLQANAGKILADGKLELVMVPIAPTVTDSTPMVNQAAQLLANPLTIQAYDPVEDESINWSLSPVEWSGWLTAVSDSSQPTGLALSLDTTLLRNFLNERDSELGASDRYLKVDEALADIQSAFSQNTTTSVVRVFHGPIHHTVLPGQTISSIAYDYGIPFPWIQQANPGISESLSVGQTLTIPSKDEMIPLPVIPNKRIVVSISQQKMWAYENGGVKWEWPVSTGIASSPTWPGIFQIQSHDGTAYAGNWNLWMPSFMGVYRPVPTSEFMNGFHGFPSRNGSQLLWTSNLGSPVTYGCILLSSDNASQLYDWAEEGVVVEIQR